MIPEKLKKLIELLILRTAAKTAIWNKGSAYNQFKLSATEGMAITIIHWPEEYSDPDIYLITIFNINGDPIESFNTHHDNASPESFELLKQLYKAVSDQYYKVEETMDALLASLASQEIVGNRENPITEVQPEDDLPF